MADVHSPEVRSKNMRAIRGRDTKPELIIRKGLHHLGFRYRISPPELPGKPDLYFPKFRAVIFVHGCFWHAHRCYMFHLPATRREFWKEKLNKSVQRDQKVIQALLRKGLRVLVVWECSVKGKKKIKRELLIDGIARWLYSENVLSEYDVNGLWNY
ncbi:very short patch repair endonuclease [Oceanimonas smirnovii]|uniref:very short patch repair endonuclease n=1 Tax=Oceanimonas smirnovii TaxID=264574 RepID=UPI003AAEA446